MYLNFTNESPPTVELLNRHGIPLTIWEADPDNHMSASDLAIQELTEMLRAMPLWAYQRLHYSVTGKLLGSD